MKNIREFSGESQKNGPIAERARGLGKKQNKNYRDRKGESNDNPEIPNRVRCQTSLAI